MNIPYHVALRSYRKGIFPSPETGGEFDGRKAIQCLQECAEALPGDHQYTLYTTDAEVAARIEAMNCEDGFNSQTGGS